MGESTQNDLPTNLFQAGLSQSQISRRGQFCLLTNRHSQAVFEKNTFTNDLVIFLEKLPKNTKPKMYKNVQSLRHVRLFATP